MRIPLPWKAPGHLNLSLFLFVSYLQRIMRCYSFLSGQHRSIMYTEVVKTRKRAIISTGEWGRELWRETLDNISTLLIVRDEETLTTT